MWNAIGSLSEIFAAIAALGALVAAVLAGKYTKGMLETERQRDERAAAQSRERDAIAVACWPAVAISHEGTPSESYKFGMTIRNASNTVMYDIRIVFADGARPPITLTALPPDTYFMEPDDRYGWAFAKSLSQVQGEVRPVTKRDTRVEALTFRDSANVRWRRSGDGLLECLSERGSVVSA